ncbi:MAG: 3-deoxy-manno-octulosonate cytidylyltransferase [Gammaproteobacteria bacterium RIFCSPHIGHO2_12_FULL_42_13]|nr:MAG: 3-deoxy-manno-octulosonate cytidylyltransferase [Gammaproteobacteria bacterium RIFCSPHIGHO2_12_FULL_42_13]
MRDEKIAEEEKNPVDFHVVIPARYASTRLAHKVLQPIHNKPMVQHVYDAAIASGAESVTIATEDEHVATACKKFGAEVCMTSDEHQTGTERVAEAVATVGFDEEDIVVCLQADEPMMPSQLIYQVAQDLANHDQVKVATIATPIKQVEELFNPAVVKVALNHRNYALYFSRAPIPWDREHFSDKKNHEKIALEYYFRHLGIYAYHAGFLDTYVNWTQPAIEKLESLEQLRVLWQGYKIHVHITDFDVPPGVDTPEDLERIRKLPRKS